MKTTMCQCAATLSDAALNGPTAPCNQASVFPPFPRPTSLPRTHIEQGTVLANKYLK